MYRNTVYRAWPGALEDAVCDAIIAAGDRVTQVPAAVGSSGDGGGHVELRTRGSVIVFPTSVLHIASPVTRGVRQSLVAWILGPSLR